MRSGNPIADQTTADRVPTGPVGRSAGAGLVARSAAVAAATNHPTGRPFRGSDFAQQDVAVDPTCFVRDEKI